MRLSESTIFRYFSFSPFCSVSFLCEAGGNEEMDKDVGCCAWEKATRAEVYRLVTIMTNRGSWPLNDAHGVMRGPFESSSTIWSRKGRKVQKRRQWGGEAGEDLRKTMNKSNWLIYKVPPPRVNFKDGRSIIRKPTRTSAVLGLRSMSPWGTNLLLPVSLPTCSMHYLRICTDTYPLCSFSLSRAIPTLDIRDIGNEIVPRKSAHSTWGHNSISRQGSSRL